MASTVWRGYISFGLISIPVRLYRAARAERVNLRRLYRSESSESSVAAESIRGKASEHRFRTEPEPIEEENVAQASADIRPQPSLSLVQQASIRKGTDEVLPEGSIVKGYEYEKGRFVAIEPDELKNAAPKTSTNMDIEEFVPLAEIDPVYFETSYYVTPEEAGEKAYALLYRAMQKTGLVAVAQFAMHSRSHVVVLRPGKTGLLAHTMFFASEVRAEDEFRTDISAVAPKELDLAQTLISSLTASFEPEKYKDTYRERLESLIAGKVKGHPVERIQPEPKTADVIDIADALRRSLANLKKPPASGASPKGNTESILRPPKKASRAAKSS